jgi:hypothetical protein
MDLQDGVRTAWQGMGTMRAGPDIPQQLRQRFCIFHEVKQRLKQCRLLRWVGDLSSFHLRERQGLTEVHATGPQSEIGRIGQTLGDIETTPPHLTRQTGRLVRLSALGGLVCCVLVILLYGLLRGSWLDALLAGIALGMSMLPEELADRIGCAAAGLTLARVYGLQADLLAVTQIWQQSDSGSYRVAAKGAPEAIAELCRPDDAARQALVARADRLAAAGSGQVPLLHTVLGTAGMILPALCVP